MIPKALFKKFLSEQFIASVEVCNMARCSSKPRVCSIGCLCSSWLFRFPVLHSDYVLNKITVLII